MFLWIGLQDHVMNGQDSAIHYTLTPNVVLTKKKKTNPKCGLFMQAWSIEGFGLLFEFMFIGEGPNLLRITLHT